MRQEWHWWVQLAWDRRSSRETGLGPVWARRGNGVVPAGAGPVGPAWHWRDPGGCSSRGAMQRERVAGWGWGDGEGISPRKSRVTHREICIGRQDVGEDWQLLHLPTVGRLRLMAVNWGPYEDLAPPTIVILFLSCLGRKQTAASSPRSPGRGSTKGRFPSTLFSSSQSHKENSLLSSSPRNASRSLAIWTRVFLLPTMTST